MKPIDAYIARFPANVKRYLQQLRALITATAPSAEEAMRYGIPTFRYLKKNLVHFGGFKDHVSFFPGAAGISTFASELTRFKVSKGTIQFPLDAKLPTALIRRIVRFRIQQCKELTSTNNTAAK
ncbi:MAG: DUF1801 domain-containing protein [Candidatus Pacebacteria bacterium]|nr:DUF1801 domain-containing protein [Candidatus Paceibacterota bacterium]